MSKSRYFKFENVTIYLRLDDERSSPHVTLAGALIAAEGQIGSIVFDTEDMECDQIMRKDAPGELK